MDLSSSLISHRFLKIIHVIFRQDLGMICLMLIYLYCFTITLKNISLKISYSRRYLTLTNMSEKNNQTLLHH